MTTLFPRRVRCAVCGMESEFPTVVGAHTRGSPDLDLRPPETQRSTLFTWVQRCPGCGYCHADIGTACPGCRAVLESETYREQLSNPAYPELANAFLCKSMIDLQAGDVAKAVWAQIHAAWACDDTGARGGAAACRGRAAAMLRSAMAEGVPVAEPEEAAVVLLVDLLRRAGDGEAALQVIQTRSGEAASGRLRRLLAFEESLIANGDVEGHTMDEALAGGPARVAL